MVHSDTRGLFTLSHTLPFSAPSFPFLLPISPNLSQSLPVPPQPPTHPRLVPDAEVMYVVSEILSEVPRPQHWQFAVLVNHMKLLEAILQHCSIPRERYSDTAALLHRIAVRMNNFMCISVKNL